MLDMIEKCHSEVLSVYFFACEINDHGIESAVTTFINQANTLNCSKGCFRLRFSDPGITYNGVRSLTKLMSTKNVSLIEFQLQSKIDFITLNLPRPIIMCENSFSHMSSRHIENYCKCVVGNQKLRSS